MHMYIIHASAAELRGMAGFYTEYDFKEERGAATQRCITVNKLISYTHVHSVLVCLVRNVRG